MMSVPGTLVDTHVHDLSSYLYKRYDSERDQICSSLASFDRSVATVTALVVCVIPEQDPYRNGVDSILLITPDHVGWCYHYRSPRNAT